MADNFKDAFKKAGIEPSKQSPMNSTSQPKQAVNTDTAVSMDYISKAEIVIKELRNDKHYKNFTTSKIRNILSQVNEIYNDVLLTEKDEILSEEIQSRILYLKVRLIYECGREPIIKTFYQKAELDSMISGIGNNREKFIAFARYMEALVAYHRFYGGRDN